jgi:protein-tyrosine phosphatase
MAEQIAQGVVHLGGSFAEHRITGRVHHAPPGVDPNIDVPLVSHVIDNLYQGGCMHGVQLPEDFRYVVSLYPWEKYRLPEGCFRKEVRMYDSLDQATGRVDELAADVVTYCKNGPTLVHCQAGLNRSGLVAARALTLMGYSGKEAIALLRRRSPLVLCNQTFASWIEGIA